LSINVTAIRLEGGSKHEHITHLWWVGREDNKPGDASRASVVAWIEEGGRAYVRDEQGHDVAVHVVTPPSGPKYLQTRADGIWTDNLLSLPRR
jgi:hypothetical protein